MRMRNRLGILLLAALVLLPIRSLSAQEKLSAEQVLDKLDKVANGFDDQEMDIEMTIIDTGGSKKSYNFNIKQKGNDRRLVRFRSGEIKGMATLTEAANRAYVYLPGYKKVRRVAAHNMNQSFAGSDFSNSDMATSCWKCLYDGTVEREDASHYTLTLTPKKGTDTGYARVSMKVSRQSFRQEDTDYFNAAGDLVKTFRVSNTRTYSCGVTQPETIEMADPRSGHKTTLTVKELKVNQGFKDSMFTERELQWGK